MSGKRKLRVSPFGLSAEFQRLINTVLSDEAMQPRCTFSTRALQGRSRRTSMCGMRRAAKKCQSLAGRLQDLLHVTGPAPEDAELANLFKPELLH
jgi:hypothetical protein